MTSHYSMRLSLLIAVAPLVAAVAPATAEVVQIPAPALVRQCPCDIDESPAVENNGTITPARGASSYFAALPFTGKGEVCSMTIVYRDVNENEALTVSLFRKKIEVGAKIDAKPVLIATVKSASGTPDTVRKTSAKKINNPSVDTGTAFYYLRAEFQNLNMDLVGVQVDIRKTCPS